MLDVLLPDRVAAALVGLVHHPRVLWIFNTVQLVCRKCLAYRREQCVPRLIGVPQVVEALEVRQLLL